MSTAQKTIMKRTVKKTVCMEEWKRTPKTEDLFNEYSTEMNDAEDSKRNPKFMFMGEWKKKKKENRRPFNEYNTEMNDAEDSKKKKKDPKFMFIEEWKKDPKNEGPFNEHTQRKQWRKESHKLSSHLPLDHVSASIILRIDQWTPDTNSCFISQDLDRSHARNRRRMIKL